MNIEKKHELALKITDARTGSEVFLAATDLALLLALVFKQLEDSKGTISLLSLAGIFFLLTIFYGGAEIHLRIQYRRIPRE